MPGIPCARFADTFPQLAADIVEMLRADGDTLADTVEALPYFGRCTCTATCTKLLTSPPGSPSPYVVDLERGDDVAVWLFLDPTRTAITTVEVLDGRDPC